MNRVFKIIAYCRVEPLLMCLLMALNIRGVTFMQLIQDKICKVHYNKSDDFCRHLSELGDNDEGADIKSAVLVASSEFQMYYQALAYLPSMLLCVFLGSWCDNYPPGRIILLYISAVGMCVETVLQAYMAYDFDLDYRFLILAAIPPALGGGLGTGFAAIFSYIPATTPTSIRTIRYMLVEVACWLSNPLATLLGGFLLNYNITVPIGGNGQLLNYQMVFIVSLVSSVLAIIWTLFMVNEKKEKEVLMAFETHSVNNDTKAPVDTIVSTIDKRKSLASLSTVELKRQNKNGLQLLFDFDNVRDIIRTGTRTREHGRRRQLWLIVSSLVIVLMAHLAPVYVMYPFTQKVYNWNSETFSYTNSLAQFCNSIGILLGTVLLTKVLKLDDIVLALIGIAAYFLCSILRGSLLNLFGFWSSTIVGCIGGTAPVGMRSYISKIIETDEIGKVMSLIAAIDSAIPLIATFFFTMIFTRTLDSFAGTVFEVTAALIVIPFLSLLYIHIFCRNGSIDSVDCNANVRQTQNNMHTNSEQIFPNSNGLDTHKHLSTDL